MRAGVQFDSGVNGVVGKVSLCASMQTNRACFFVVAGADRANCF